MIFVPKDTNLILKDIQNIDLQQLLIESCFYNKYDIVKILVNPIFKLNLNQENSNGHIALIIAAKYFYKNIVVLLLRNGAKPFYRNYNGVTAADYVIHEIESKQRIGLFDWVEDGYKIIKILEKFEIKRRFSKK